jgi:hypothetical protein
MATRYPTPQEEPINVGEGITRTSDPRAKLWPVTITFTTGARALRTTIRALGPLQAEQFARARHINVRTVAVARRPQ